MRLQASLLATAISCGGTAEALTISPVSGATDEYRIAFDPITFTTIEPGGDLTPLEGVGFAFVDVLTGPPTDDGRASGGSVTLARPDFATDPGGVPTRQFGETGGLRGPLTFSVGEVNEDDLIVLFGDAVGFSFSETVIVSADDLRFTYSGGLPGIAGGPYAAFLVDNGGTRISDVVQVAAVPLPVGALLLLSAVGTGAVLRGRRAA